MTPLPKGSLRGLKMCVLDVEAIRWKEPYAVGFYDGETYTRFDGRDCVEKCLEHFITHRYRGYTCFAHNGGKYDFSFFLEEMFKKGYFKKFVVDMMEIHGRFAQIRISTFTLKAKGKKFVKEIKDSWNFQDSVALLPSSLRDLAKAYGVKHLKGEFDHKSINWSNWMTLEPKWGPYLKSDVLGLYEVMRGFEWENMMTHKVDITECVTLPQLALKNFRTNDLTINIPSYDACEGDVRKAYRGGRTEVFMRSGEKLRYYDVNSLYPSVMLNEMPVGKPAYDVNFKIGDFGVCRATVTVPQSEKYPLLSSKRKIGKSMKLFFMGGTYEDWFTSVEMDEAVRLGYDIKIHEGYHFKKAQIFKGFVDRMYGIRKKAAKDTPQNMTAKLTMNSLYGKFGQKREKSRIIVNPDDRVGLEVMYADMEIYKKGTRSRGGHILPAIAAFVTAYARIHLHQIFKNIEEMGGKVYYCDTDSVLTDVVLPCGEKLGELKDVLNQTCEAVFLAPKMYALRTQDGKEYVVCKGFPREKFTFDMMKQSLHGEVSLVSFVEKFSTVKMALRKNNRWYDLLTRNKSVRSVYDKRIVCEDRVSTRPYICGADI